MSNSKEVFGVPHIGIKEIKLIKLLGKGCFGKVYLGNCRAIEVAVKVPNKQKLSAKVMKNFIAEVEIMSSIYHPNVCLFMGACTAPGCIRIVQEKLSGDLETRIHSNEEIDLVKRLTWAKEACQGMNWLHKMENPVIHRDLKPANLLYDENDKIKVCDFGLSHFQEEGLYDKEPKGTPLYMAPEVMLKQEITTKVDVYSMGIIIWELVTRLEPFEEHDDYDVFMNCVVNEHERPEIPQDCPESLEQLMRNCWAHNPEDRPDFQEIVTTLDDIIKEVQILEYQYKVNEAIKNKIGTNIWINGFDKESVAWEEFSQHLYNVLELEYPNKEESPLPLNASVDLIESASEKQLLDYAKFSEETGQIVRDELQRRKDTQFYTNPPVNEDVKLLCLKEMLANKKDMVTTKSFGDFCARFGPIEIPYVDGCGFIDRVVDTMKLPGFYGLISSGEAENKLKGKDLQTGSYLIRFSGNTRGSYCLSFLIRREKKGRIVKHMLIPYKCGKGFKLDNIYYHTIEDLILENEEKYTLKHPIDSAFSWMFEQESTISAYLVDDSFSIADSGEIKPSEIK
eukprot:TRINITY_DN4306_c0_g1_i1.p1 TRINITY_DN4306_c0_g1~~TRINITY_DN4306_c0_g1_i1.p1  ORF type:complete len:577 (-),score=183.46 TRINITY_DN4306_c0_g1_i1:103-1800(-)